MVADGIQTDMAFPHDGKKFKPGQTGNPNGRPTIKPIEEAFQEFLSADHEHKGKSKQRLEWLIERVFTDAMNGKPQAQALAFERAFGKPKQDINLGGQNGTNPIAFSSLGEIIAQQDGDTKTVK